MRPDQEQSLADLTEKLADVFLSEADPGNWNGAGESQAEMTKETRGARNWDMKNANQAGALVMRALEIKARLGGAPAAPQDEPELDIAKFEKQARELIASAGKRGP